MSVRTMARVWDHSQHSGSGLLMLLAIADFADDDGRAYPAVATLATKCRMTSRNVNLILAELRKSGELEVMQNAGPRGTNMYVIRTATLKNSSPLNHSSPLKESSSTPEALFPSPLKSASDEPSVNHQEPSVVDCKQSAASKVHDVIRDAQQQDSLISEHLPQGEGPSTTRAIPAPKKAATKSHRLPDGWTLPNDLGQWAMEYAHENGCPVTAGEVRRTAEQFADYWHSSDSKTAEKRNWDAAWRFWWRKEVDTKTNALGRISVADRRAGNIAALCGDSSRTGSPLFPGEFIEGQARVINDAPTHDRHRESGHD